MPLPPAALDAARHAGSSLATGQLPPGFELPALPFERHSLEPGISRSQVDLLYSHYHRRQLEIVNRTPDRNLDASLADLAASPAFFGAIAAGEAWNLTFFWHGLSVRPASPDERFSDAIFRDFESWDGLRRYWRAMIRSSDHPWCWLVASAEGGLELVGTPTGKRPRDATALIAIALMPDAYRLDHAGDRGAYFDALWPRINWEYAALCWQVAG